MFFSSVASIPTPIPSATTFVPPPDVTLFNKVASACSRIRSVDQSVNQNTLCVDEKADTTKTYHIVDGRLPQKVEPIT